MQFKMKQEEDWWYILSPRWSKSYFPPSWIIIHLENETDDLQNYLNTFVKTLEPDWIIDEPTNDKLIKSYSTILIWRMNSNPIIYVRSWSTLWIEYTIKWFINRAIYWDEPIADEYNKKFPDYDINYLQLLSS